MRRRACLKKTTQEGRDREEGKEEGRKGEREIQGQVGRKERE